MTNSIGTMCSQRKFESGSPRFAMALSIINPKNLFLRTPFYINARTQGRKKVDLDAQQLNLLKFNLIN